MGAGTVEMIERDLARCREIADIDDVDVTARRDADSARSFLADEGEPLVTGDSVVEPPDVVHLAAGGEHVTERNRIGDRAGTGAPDVPDLHARVPQRSKEDAVAHEYVMDEWAAHYRGED